MSTAISKAGKRVLTAFEKGNGTPSSPSIAISQPNTPAAPFNTPVPVSHGEFTPKVNGRSEGVSLPFPTLSDPNTISPKRHQAENMRKESFDLDATLQECMTLDQTAKSRMVDTPTKAIVLSPRMDVDMNISIPQTHAIFEDSSATGRLLKFNKDNTSSSWEKRGNLSRKLSSSRDDMSPRSKSPLPSKDSEKEQLLAQLEALKQQNQMLTLNIMKTQEDSRAQLELERQRRMQMVADLEKENKLLLQQLIDAKLSAEQQLEQAKVDFIDSIHRMEGEKQRLMEKILATEEQAADEAGYLKMQSLEMERRVRALEEEKKMILKRSKEIEEANGHNMEAMHDEMKQEAMALLVKLQTMEEERNKIQTDLTENEKRSQEAAEKLAIQLENDRKEMSKKMAAMEFEKQELSKRLLEAETLAKTQADAMQSQLEKQKDTAVVLVEALEKEKQELQRHSPKQSKSDKSENNMFLLDDEVVNEMVKEKESLQERLRASAEQSKTKVKELTEKLQRAKQKRLAKTVNKMKSSFIEEKKNSADNTPEKAPAIASPQQMTRKTSNYTNGNTNSGESHGLKTITSKRSLLDMIAHPQSAAISSANSTADGSYQIIGTGNIHGMNPRKGPNRLSLVMNKIEEIPQEKTFMDYDSDEENDKMGTSEMKATEETEDFSDLPAPHAAAATGDMKRLNLFVKLDVNLLFSLDSIGRQPIFYAAAHGQKDAVTFLLSLINPFDMLIHQDNFGDSTLHAACASGDSDIVTLIAEKLSNEVTSRDLHIETYVNIKNHAGMTPAHLADNGEVLEILTHYNLHLAEADNQDRTPLFIACALNHASCVEYLVESLDHSEETLLRKDYRGDTPLHAAACNNSVDCLLILLQFGIDPRLPNQQGLTAIDLAIRNKNTKCREILAEYHLHYCTSSEFDSVLFLATLEGHRMIAQLKQSALQHNYNLNSPLATGGKLSPLAAKKNHPLQSFQSMFSLRGAQSMRLQRFGNWIAYHDPNSTNVFYYNHDKNSGQWEIPDEIKEYEKMNRSHEDIFDKTLQAKMSMRIKTDGDWIQYTTEKGRTFFYNQKDGSFQWDPPNSNLHSKHHEYQVAYDMSDVSASAKSYVYQSQQIHDEKLSDWKPYMDEKSGVIFWYNHVTNVSQWENPFETSHNHHDDNDGYQNYHVASGDENWHHTEEDVIPVYHDHDLGL